MNENSVYVQTNDSVRNEVLAFGRAADGTLASRGAVATGGRGTGKPHLASQSSVALSDDGRACSSVRRHAHAARLGRR